MIGRWWAQVSTPQRLVGAAALVVLAGSLFVRVASGGPARRWAGSTIELLALLALVAVAVLPVVPWRKLYSGIGPLRLGVIVALLVGVLAGQHVRDRDLYPFKRWDMYTQPQTRAQYVELAMYQGGRAVGPLPLVDALPGTSVRAYMSGLHGQALLAEDGDDRARAVVEDALQRAVDEAGVEGVDTVAVELCEVAGPTRDQPSTCRVVLEVAVEEGAR